MAKIEFTPDINSERSFSILSLIKNLFIVMAATLIVLLGFALIISIANIPDNIINFIVAAVTVLGMFLCAFLSGRKVKSKGWLNGIIAGVLYAVILRIIAFFAFDSSLFRKSTFSLLLLGIFFGAIGGIFGVNMRKSGK